jgi:hypothetical protein
MFNSDILEVTAGIIFVFVLFSTICSAVREWIEAMLRTRAAYLEYGIRELLQDRLGEGLAKEIFTHPLIAGLYTGDYQAGKSGPKPPWSGKTLPTYIPARSFAVALLDITARSLKPDAKNADGQIAAPTIEQLRANVANLGNAQVERVLLTAIDSSQDLTQVRANIEAWYDSSMDRVSGWYKHSTHWVIFWVALVMAVGINVNTITITDYLYRHDAERSAIISTIEKTAADNTAPDGEYRKAMDRLEAIHLPMGWTDGWGAPRTRSERNAQDISVWQDIFAPVLGWLLTAFAATLGAPFWFDLLNKVMVIRSTVKPAEKSGEEPSKDPRPTPAPAEAPVSVVSVGASAPAAAPVAVADEDDACSSNTVTATPDDKLPPARGGVV